jgi:hypothetical protein
VAGGYDFSRMRTVVDVGGGTGTLAGSPPAAGIPLLLSGKVAW